MFFEYSLICMIAFLAMTSSIIILFSSTLMMIFFFGIFSLLTAMLYLVLHAPDVAITETAVGAAISTIFFLISYRAIENNIRKSPKNLEKRNPIILISSFLSFEAIPILLVMAVIFVGLCDMFFAISSGNHNIFDTDAYYLRQTSKEIGISNVVTAVLASYRGFDTLIENCVIFVSAIGVFSILRSRNE